MSGGYGFGHNKLLCFLLIIATIFCLFCNNSYGGYGGGCGC
ncbi:hypothetical protein [Risungbinella massiliensis]|nr:hypothetical protein [Risungbinella massiliensis]